jgi:hypothetical protein
LIAATQSLALTKTQAAIFLALVPTDRKIVGVMICSIRKRLRHGPQALGASEAVLAGRLI